MNRGLVLLTALALLPSCSAKEAVSISASLGNAQIAVGQASGGLVSNLSGVFDVTLELGERASGATTVSFTAFSLVRADTEVQVLNAPEGKPLSWVASPKVPVQLNPGDKVVVHLTVGNDKGGTVEAMELPPQDKQNVCSAGQLKIVGTIQDSLNGARTTPVSSSPFSPSGC